MFKFGLGFGVKTKGFFLKLATGAFLLKTDGSKIELLKGKQ